MASKRICYSCGSEYEYCTRCSAYADQPKWRWMWDTEECKEIYNAVSGYKMGIKSADDVKLIVDNYNVTDFSKYVSTIQDCLNELCSKQSPYIYNAQRKNNKKNKMKEMDIELKQEDKVEDAVENPTIEDVEIEKTLSSILELEGISEE